MPRRIRQICRETLQNCGALATMLRLTTRKVKGSDGTATATVNVQPMNTTDLAERLQAIEALLHQRRFDFALSVATRLEETIALLAEDTRSRSCVPTSIRQRARSLRWAAEVGSQLAHLVRRGVRRQPYSPRMG